MHLWKIVKRNWMAGLAWAAAIVLVVLLLLSLLTGHWDGTTAAYAKVTEAVRNVPWMHVRYTGCTLDDEGNKKSEHSGWNTELWYSFNSQVLIQRYDDGQIVYSDYAKHEVCVYNPVSKRVVLSALPDDQLSLQADSPWTWLQRNVRHMTPRGRDVTRSMGQYEGQEVEIFSIVATFAPPMSTYHGTVFVDRTTSLPIAEERTYISARTGKPDLVETGTFDYPEHGPADIYSLGLPRDVPVVNSLPLPPSWEILHAYESHRFRVPAERYIAVMTQQMHIGGSPVDTVDVFYCDGARYRAERHFVCGTGFVGEQWRQQAPEVGTTFDSILKWSRSYKAFGGVSIALQVRNHLWEWRRNENGSWSATERTIADVEFTQEDFWSLCPAFGLGRPDIWGNADVVQDDYARENHLIRLETPKGVFYLNPDRDYICQRKIVHPDDRVEDVTEFGRTDDGRWYPKKVEDVATHTIYLETDPKFPEGIFDPNSLPKADREAASVP